MEKPGLSYKDAGVDIDAASESVEMMKKWIKTTTRPEVMGEIGSFGGLFALGNKYKKPVLVSGTDGVGTKLMVAHSLDIHDTVGIDLVAMCVNDILTHGAEPLFFLDYIATGKLMPAKIEKLVKGISQGCVEAGCALIGGETAEMPGFYRAEEYDLAGFAVGVVEEDNIITGKAIENDDVIIGLPSTGLHSNGFSLARKVLLEKAGLAYDSFLPQLNKTIGEELLTPTKIYVKPILALLSQVTVKGMAHITGGGILENLERILPQGQGALIEREKIPSQPIFHLIQELGGVEPHEMFRTFNMGVGFTLIVSPRQRPQAMELLQEAGENPAIIGKVVAQAKGVKVV
ncbi:MAG: phosphoribosylformylglycinamidine cyclo-ligase [Syntrophomonadaceae bacterium]|jgi:phosphoribosylformylglycinamidine cyclo-ligase